MSQSPTAEATKAPRKSLKGLVARVNGTGIQIGGQRYVASISKVAAKVESPEPVVVTEPETKAD